MKNKIKQELQNSPILLKISASIYHVYTFFSIIFFRILSIPFYFFPKHKRILISNYGGKGFFDNPKYAAKVIRTYDADIEIIWLLNDVEDESIPLELNIKKVKNTFFNQLYYLSTSLIWIDTLRKKFIPLKHKDQLYVQFWHGGLGMKKVEHSLNLTLIHRFSAYLDTKNTDIMISNSNHLSKIYRNDFKYSGKIAQIGYPMNDVLFQDRKGLDSKYFDILYVPTYRGNEKKATVPSYFPNIEELVKELKEYIPNVRIIIRPHPSLELNLSQLYGENKRIIDGSQTEDIKDIISRVDLVISDYSSAIFDCVVTKTPGIIFARDYSRYENRRGLYYKLDELPFPYTFEDTSLAQEILSFNQEVYEEKCNEFIQNMRLVDDGNASERFYQLLLNESKLEKNK